MSEPATVFSHDAKRRAGEIEGFTFGSDVSVIVVEYGVAGMGPKLHTHPYAETFIVIEGQATFEVGAERIDAVAGMALVAPAGVPHRFENAGPGRLLQVDIHSSDRFVTEWLEP
jgi:mannose-6-phosphate isomerase-like protein (cupin superfamily)